MQCPKCQTTLELKEQHGEVMAGCSVCGFQKRVQDEPLTLRAVYEFRATVWAQLQ
jgi:Zn ribbon nucleic-acid-binding protein